MKNSRLSMLIKLTLFLICTVAVLCVPAYFIYQNVKSTIVNELGRNAINIAATISAFAENNIERYQNIPPSSFDVFSESDLNGMKSSPSNTSPAKSSIASNGNDVLNTGESPKNTSAQSDGDNADNPFQKELTGMFSALIQVTGAQNIYIEKKLQDSHRAFLFEDNFNQKNRYLTKSTMTENELMAFNDGVMAPTGIISDDTVGEFIAGYAPIKDAADGNVVGIVAVEFSFKYADHITHSIWNIIIFSFSVIAVLTTSVLYLLAKSRQKYIKKDYLTELCNKSYFEKSLKAETRMAKDRHRPLSLLMIDIDQFKYCNDTFGHPVGDSILKAVSETLLTMTRNIDLCARYGGDEFVVLLTNAGKTQAAAAGERIRDAVSRLHHFSEHSDISVTISVGAAELEHDMTSESLLKYADEAMYISKSTGKNKVTVYKSKNN
jgi:diguanylate cyclase (GGDEF)-like protein